MSDDQISAALDIPPELQAAARQIREQVDEVAGPPRPEADVLAKAIIELINRRGPHQNIVTLDAVAIVAGVIVGRTPEKYRGLMKIRLVTTMENIWLPGPDDGDG